MPRNGLTEEQKQFIRDNAALGGVALSETLSETLNVDRAQIYQFAVIEQFSVKKGGPKPTQMELMKKCYSKWPRQYRKYKEALVLRDGLRCHYCDYLMDYKNAQIDHIIPKARGGSDAPSNLVLSCARCNNAKSTLCYSCPEFRDKLSTEVIHRR